MPKLKLAIKREAERRDFSDNAPIPFETLKSIFQETLSDLDRRCVEGLLGEADPSILAQEQEAKKHLDRVWKECLAGKASLDDFKEATRAWHKAVVALFSVHPSNAEGRLF